MTVQLPEQVTSQVPPLQSTVEPSPRVSWQVALEQLTWAEAPAVISQVPELQSIRLSRPTLPLQVDEEHWRRVLSPLVTVQVEELHATAQPWPQFWVQAVELLQASEQFSPQDCEQAEAALQEQAGPETPASLEFPQAHDPDWQVTAGGVPHAQPTRSPAPSAAMNGVGFLGMGHPLLTTTNRDRGCGVATYRHSVP